MVNGLLWRYSAGSPPPAALGARLRPNVCVPIATLLVIAWAGSARAAPQDGPTEGFGASAPEEQGMDSVRLAEMLSFLAEQGTLFHGIVIARHGRIVLETYAAPYGPDRPYEVRDVAHAAVSMLVGMAVADGRLSLDQEVSALFPDVPAGPGVKGVTLRHLLTMTSGLGAPREVPPGDDAAWTRALLAVPRVAPLGQFTAGEVNVSLAQAALARTVGRPLSDYARERLFGPLGIRVHAFGSDAATSSGGRPRLLVSPRDLAKLGHLYLRRGAWQGTQLVPASWIEESTRTQADSSGQNLNVYIRGDAYGYLWWVDGGGAYSAASAPGEYLFVVPDQDVVAVFTGNLYCDRRLARELMKVFVLPSVRTEGALPPNPAGVAALAARARELE